MADKPKDPLARYLGKPDEKSSREQFEHFEAIVADAVEKLRGKNRETVLREIEELEGKNEVKDEVGRLIHKIRGRILEDLAKIGREAEKQSQKSKVKSQK